MKKIKMTRSELVWETREAYFDKRAWKKMLAWLKDYADRDTGKYAYERNMALVYNRVKDMTFEDVVADIEAYENKENYIVFTFTNISRSRKGDMLCYDKNLYDLVVDWLRNDCVVSEIVDYNYADDYEEDIEVVEEQE